MKNIYDSPQANFTVFVCSDFISNLQTEWIDALDIGDARRIIMGSTIKNRIPSEILTDSPSSYFMTCNPQYRILITNENNVTQINRGCTVVMKDIMASNGIIHIVDKLITE